jgi:hemoglobin
MTTSSDSDFERLGGEAGLRALVQAFVDRVFSDTIIGFHFAGKDKDRIVEKEIEHARLHLGGGGAYTGREIGAVHQPLKINLGQFRRRLAILRKVLDDAGVEPEVRDRWIAHNQALIDRITSGADCLP